MCVGDSLLSRFPGNKRSQRDPLVCAFFKGIGEGDLFSYYSFEGSLYTKRCRTVYFTWRRSPLISESEAKELPQKITIIAYDVSCYISKKCATSTVWKASDKAVQIPFLRSIPSRIDGQSNKLCYRLRLTRDMSAEVIASDIHCECLN